MVAKASVEPWEDQEETDFQEKSRLMKLLLEEKKLAQGSKEEEQKRTLCWW